MKQTAIIFLLLSKLSFAQINETFEESFPPDNWTHEGFASWNQTYHYSENHSVRFSAGFLDTSHTWLISPQQINFQDTAINFWSMQTNTNSDSYMGIWVSSGEGIPFHSDFQELAVISSTSAPYEWENIEISLAGFLGQNVYIAFVFMPKNNPNVWYIDDVKTLPSSAQNQCASPTNLNINNTTATSALVSWSQSDSNVNYILEYGLIGFQTGTGSYIQTTNTEIVIDSLLEGESYTVYLTAICSNGDTTSVLSTTLTTTCTIRTVPFIEYFDSMTVNNNNLSDQCSVESSLENCFRNDTENYVNWIVRSDPTPTTATGPQSDFSGTGNYVFIESTQVYPCLNHTYSSLISPPISLMGSTNPRLKFKYHIHAFNTNETPELKVYVSEYKELNWTVKWQVYGDQGPNWNEAIVNLTSGFMEDTILIRFEANWVESFSDIALDEIEVINDLTTKTPQLFLDRKFEFFPNPATEQLNIQFFEQMQNVEITVLSVDGKRIEQTRVSLEAGSSTILDISAYAPGTYYMQVNTQNEIFTEKFVKQ